MLKMYVIRFINSHWNDNQCKLLEGGVHIVKKFYLMLNMKLWYLRQKAFTIVPRIHSICIQKYMRSMDSMVNAICSTTFPVCSVLAPARGRPVPALVAAATAATPVYCHELPTPADQPRIKSETTSHTSTFANLSIS